MSSIFFKNKPGQIGQLILDVRISETHTRQSNITTSPIEEGKQINDNIVTDPEKISVAGMVTNSPVQILGGILNKGVSTDSRDKTAFDYLDKIWREKILVNVVSKFKVYANMAIDSLNTVYDKTTGQALRFTAELTQITKVSSKSVKIPANKVKDGTKRDQAQSKKDAGDQSANNANKDQSSIGYNLLQSGGFIN